MERLKVKIKDYLLFHLWNSHESISNGDLGIITNPLEIINRKLKSKMGHVYIIAHIAYMFIY